MVHLAASLEEKGKAQIESALLSIELSISINEDDVLTKERNQPKIKGVNQCETMNLIKRTRRKR